MKTLLLLVLAIFISARGAHNRIQFEPKYKNESALHGSFTADVAHQLLLKSMHRPSKIELANTRVENKVRKGKILFATGMTRTAPGVIALPLSLVFLLSTASSGTFRDILVIIGIVLAALAVIFLIAGIISTVIGRKMYRTNT